MHIKDHSLQAIGFRALPTPPTGWHVEETPWAPTEQEAPSLMLRLLARRPAVVVPLTGSRVPYSVHRSRAQEMDYARLGLGFSLATLCNVLLAVASLDCPS